MAGLLRGVLVPLGFSMGSCADYHFERVHAVECQVLVLLYCCSYLRLTASIFAGSLDKFKPLSPH